MTGRRNTSDNWPLAYLLTFTAYGSWLPGDERTWVTRSANSFGSARLDPSSARRDFAGSRLSRMPSTFPPDIRQSIEEAIRETCHEHAWQLLALNVRTNHVHVVVSAPLAPERVLVALKAWSTRRLRAAALVGPDERMWTKHGSTRYLWREEDVERGCTYVTEGQGPDLQ